MIVASPLISNLDQSRGAGCRSIWMMVPMRWPRPWGRRAAIRAVRWRSDEPGVAHP